MFPPRPAQGRAGSEMSGLQEAPEKGYAAVRGLAAEDRGQGAANAGGGGFVLKAALSDAGLEGVEVAMDAVDIEIGDIAAAEAAVAIAIIIIVYRRFNDINVEDVSDMKF